MPSNTMKRLFFMISGVLMNLLRFCERFNNLFKPEKYTLAMIKNFEPRLYQQTILNTASEKNTLVVLPTGMGKTNIFLMLAAHRLNQFPNSKILFIGPTKPLIDQY